MPEAHATSTLAARRYLLGGRVQGVGFRPFVYRLAHAHGIRGWVRNRTGQVEILAEGPPAALARFEQALVQDAPPLAQPQLLAREAIAPASLADFSIHASDASTSPEIHVPPDYYACADCVRELNDPNDRRYRYPFINCTQCGPRYTLISRLPYDRPHTTMHAFVLCPECRREYEDPRNRRFHAEPLACPVCGPKLQWREGTTSLTGEAALAACAEALRRGQIVAVKGIGGYHLMCDARNDTTVARLRAHKPRPHKPLAVMVPLRGSDGLDVVRELTTLTPTHTAALLDPMRPIVLVPKRDDAVLAATIAPGLNEIGVFLPYSPLHHLLLTDFGGPLVATSANISGEPVLTDNGEVESRLAHVAEAFLHHDRSIARPADDPVIRVIANTPRPLRLGRGNAPLELTLPARLAQPLLAVGGHMKNTVALAWDQRVVVSPHIGDLDAPRALAVFEQVITDLQQLYGVTAQRIICDAHPGYASTRWARHSGLPVTPVYHHHAHAAALAGEYPDIERWLVFTWDGVGYGEETATGPSVARGPRLGPIGDGTLWGGEALLGAPGHWQRVASFRPFHLPGGEKAGREPWRSALALCWETGSVWRDAPPDTALLFDAWQKRLNCPATSAVGRLFDAAAALTGINLSSSFEGQGPMMLEATTTTMADPVALPLAHDAHGLLRSDWAPLVPLLLDDARTIPERSARFHASLAQTLLAQAMHLRATQGEFVVGLSGGVFQNRILAELCLARLATHGFNAKLARCCPGNDGGISYGQIIEAAARFDLT